MTIYNIAVATVMADNDISNFAGRAVKTMGGGISSLLSRYETPKRPKTDNVPKTTTPLLLIRKPANSMVTMKAPNAGISIPSEPMT